MSTVTLQEKELTIRYGDIAYSYEALFGYYLAGAKELVVEEPYIRSNSRLKNFIQLCDLCVQVETIKKVQLITGTDSEQQKAEIGPKFAALAESLADVVIEFVWRFEDGGDRREIRTNTGWGVRIDRGLDIYQRSHSWMQIGASNFNVRPCMETKVSVRRLP